MREGRISVWESWIVCWTLHLRVWISTQAQEPLIGTRVNTENAMGHRMSEALDQKGLLRKRLCVWLRAGISVSQPAALGKSQPCLPSGEEGGCPRPLPRVLSSWGSQALFFSLLPRTSSFTHSETPRSHTQSPSELPSDRAYHCGVEEASSLVGEWFLCLVCREPWGCG